MGMIPYTLETMFDANLWRQQEILWRNNLVDPSTKRPTEVLLERAHRCSLRADALEAGQNLPLLQGC